MASAHALEAAGQEAKRRVITFDTGALIAIERRRDRMLRVLRAAEQTGTPIVVPAVVLAEWWRQRPSPRMALLLEAVTIEPVGDELARAAGEAIAAVAGATTIDALVMASAALRGGVVYTSDVGDLERLRGHFPSVRVLAV
jgi:predicted nucleic acid-binding protein